MEVTELKKSLKEWERNFESKFGRKPEREDVKKDAEIGKFSSGKTITRELRSSISSSQKVQGIQQVSFKSSFKTYG
jgi:hypothetical protein